MLPKTSFVGSFDRENVKGPSPRPGDHYGVIGFCVGTAAPPPLPSPKCLLYTRDLMSLLGAPTSLHTMQLLSQVAGRLGLEPATD